METHVRTPQDVFMQPQHLVVPPFQRPYVWEKEEQWAPLWQDVRRLAELRLGAAVRRHQALPWRDRGSGSGADPRWPPASSIIDGQQRLTTLQLLMDATAAALEAVGHDDFAARARPAHSQQEIYVRGRATRLEAPPQQQGPCAVRRGDGRRCTRRSRSRSFTPPLALRPRALVLH